MARSGFDSRSESYLCLETLTFRIWSPVSTPKKLIFINCYICIRKYSQFILRACGRNDELLNIKLDGTDCYHCRVQSYIWFLTNVTLKKSFERNSGKTKIVINFGKIQTKFQCGTKWQDLVEHLKLSNLNICHSVSMIKPLVSINIRKEFLVVYY